MAGLTNEGLVIKTFEEVYSSLEETAVSLFSDIVPQGDTVDVSENTVLGRMIGVAANGRYDMWEALQYVHDSFNPNTASGIALDNLVAIGGLQRYQAQPTSIPVLLAGRSNLTLNTDFRVSSSFNKESYRLPKPVTFNRFGVVTVLLEPLGVDVGSEYSFTVNFDGQNDITVSYTSETDDVYDFCDSLSLAIEAQLPNLVTASVVPLGGVVSVGMTTRDFYMPFTISALENFSVTHTGKIVQMLAENFGDIEQPARTIDTVQNYDSSSYDIIVPFVTNIAAGTKGRLAESDEELRERFRNSKFKKASNILDSLIDAIKAIEGVEDVMVYENDQDVAVNGIPPHSFMAVIMGGEESVIAKTIWNKKPLGIQSHGDTSVTIFDSQGLTKVIKYQKPETVDISVTVTVTKIAPMASAAEAIIRQNIVDFAEGLYRIGDDVIYSRFYTPVNKVQGHYVNSLTIGVVPSGFDDTEQAGWGDWESTSNISIDYLEVARLKPEFIRVTILEE